MAQDARDLCLTDAVDALVAAEAHAASLVSDVETYRQMLAVSLDKLGAMTKLVDRQRETLTRLLEVTPARD